MPFDRQDVPGGLRASKLCGFRIVETAGREPSGGLLARTREDWSSRLLADLRTTPTRRKGGRSAVSSQWRVRANGRPPNPRRAPRRRAPRGRAPPGARQTSDPERARVRGALSRTTQARGTSARGAQTRVRSSTSTVANRSSISNHSRPASDSSDSQFCAWDPQSVWAPSDASGMWSGPVMLVCDSDRISRPPQEPPAIT